MKSIKNFEGKKISNTFQSQTKGGGIVTQQTNDATDVRIGKTVFTNLLDGTIGNGDRIKFD